MEKINKIITLTSVFILCVFGATQIMWQFDKDWTTLERDGEVIADSKWVVEAERSYINKNTWYRTNVMCPRIIKAGGYETATRCYYAPDTYELMSRSLLNTKITEENNVVTKAVPFYAYGSRGAYAGYVKETMVFSETEDITEFPKSYVIGWTPKDTRNYKLVWRLEKLDTSDYQVNECSYTFGHVKIDLKDDCDKLDYVSIEKGKATFYFKPLRANQILDIDFVDPEIIEQIAVKSTGLQIESTPDTKGTITQTEEPFHLSIDRETVQHGWLTKEDNSTVYTIYGKGLFWTDNATIPEGNKYFGISFGEKAKNGYIKHKNAEGSVWTTIESIEFNHLNTYTFDNNKTYNEVYYTTFASIPSNHTRDFKIYVELEEKPKRNNFIIYFGTGSTVIEVDIGTDLKVTQTGLDNETSYLASIDVSEGKLFMGQTDSTYDITSDLELWTSFDNGNVSGTWGTIAYDYCGNNNHGTLTNMNEGYNNGSSGWTDGNLSYGMEYDGNNDYVNCGDISSNMGTTITMSMWIYPIEQNNDEIFIHLGDSITSGDGWGGENETHISQKGNGYFGIFSRTNNVDHFNEDKFYEISSFNTWQHLTLVVNTSHVVLFLNGIQANITTVFGTPDYSTLDECRIGSPLVASRFFNGTIDDVRIYSRALSADEIEALYNVTVSNYNTTALTLHSSAVTYDIVSNENTSVVIEVPEVEYKLSFTPTYVSINYSTITFNTTDSSYFGQETVTVSENYLGEPNLTRIRINNTYAMGIYDIMNFNLSSYLSFSPNDIISIWYDSYTGNSDNSTLKDTSDYAQWVDTCESGNTTGQVLCLNFNEGFGTTAKDRANNSLNNNDGTLTNMNTGIDNGTSGWTTSGKFGGAIKFEGANDWVEIADSSELNITDSITISAWVKTAESKGYHNIVEKKDGWNDIAGYAFFLYNDGLRFRYGNGTGFCEISQTSIGSNDGAWHHVAVIRNSSNEILYFDGSSVLNEASCDMFASFGTSLGISKAGSNIDDFNGTIDEVKIWNRALSASEISDEYALKKDNFDNLLNQEGAVSAGEDLDLFVTNGTVEGPDDGTIYIYPKSNMTTSLWMIDFGLTGGGVSNYSDSCGTILTLNTDTVDTHKNGSYALSVSGEMSPLGHSEKFKFGLYKSPIRYDANSYRIFFQMNSNLTENTVTQIDLNVSEIAERTGLTTADIDTDTYRLYRISYYGGIYNDTNLCLEQPILI